MNAVNHLSTPLSIFGKQIESVNEAYRKKWAINIFVTDTDGVLLYGRAPCRQVNRPECRSARKSAIAEALRWGEPVISLCPKRFFIWGVPCMINSRVLGGVIAWIPEQDVFPNDSGKPASDIVKASGDLLQLCERENLVNAELLKANRIFHQNEQTRAEAIHEYKVRGVSALRDMYSQVEPALLLALRQGNKAEARRHINRLLIAMIHQAGGNLDLIKGLFMELVVTMYRTALELGGEAESLLGKNYEALMRIAHIDNEKQLSDWLASMLDRLMDSIHRHSPSSVPFQLYTAVQYLQANLAKRMTRDEAARIAGMSPSHFSREFKKQYRHCFSEYLNRLRVDAACELLTRTDQKLVEISMNVGFNDQSYFTNVFRRLMGITPLQYRQRHRGADEEV
jgi:AraC-like DNA-binding protein